ncbi:hypothetical protein [Streptomyces sp. JB150]|uniref:hypothetical protein n=1 Tax=Streptomyces sp. JB150 TaxID=2714844 RepID=UPI0014078683|nr:hypothetical protein [Streptomyces sp. JB150]QIJ62532.1 hypothetical protein G7Z13_11150 [Streptomyces sp. JB150]
MTTTLATDTADGLSAECTLAQRQDYGYMHRDCRRTKDIPLPHSSRVLLVRRCGCSCHRKAGGLR